MGEKEDIRELKCKCGRVFSTDFAYYNLPVHCPNCTIHLHKVFTPEEIKLFNGTIEFSGYAGQTRTTNAYCESKNHDGVENAEKDWPKGGIVTSSTTSPPTGYTIWYKHACESATYPCFREAEFTLQADESITIEALIRLENLADFSAYAPRIQIIKYFEDPLVDSSNDPLDEDLVSETTGDGSTWQELKVCTINAGDSPLKCKWRVIGYHATAAFDEVISMPDYKTQVQEIYNKIKRLGPTGQS